MSYMSDMMPSLIVAAVAPRTLKFIKKMALGRGATYSSFLYLELKTKYFFELTL